MEVKWFESTAEHVREVMGMSELEGEGEYIYRFTHYFGFPEDVVTLVSKLPPPVMEVVIAHVQYVSGEPGGANALDNREVASVITHVYGGRVISAHPHNQAMIVIDLYYNWEKFCGLLGEFDKPSALRKSAVREAVMQELEKE